MKNPYKGQENISMHRIQAMVGEEDYAYVFTRLLPYQGAQDQLLSALFHAFVTFLRSIEPELPAFYESGTRNKKTVTAIIRRCTFTYNPRDESE